MAKQDVDILIVGGGLIGAALLLALKETGYQVLLIDSHEVSNRISADFDARTLALSAASIRILEKLAVWPLLKKEATPIESIHISEQYRFGSARLDAKDSSPLGFVIEMQQVDRAIHQLLDNKAILAPAELIALDATLGLATIKQADSERVIRAKLLVAADGAHSSVRTLAGLAVKTKDYLQQAIIANIGLSRSHANRAYERFTHTGPLAMLPMSDNRASLVWALRPADARHLMAINERDFLNQLQQAFGYRLGRLHKVGKRFIYPLSQTIMSQSTAWPLVFVGNAAHTLHPVAGQGFNLGLRDVAALAQCVVQYGLNADMLAHYQTMRRYDQASIIRLTDGLVNIFTKSWPGLGLMRGLGLVAVDVLPGLQAVLKHHAGGFAGITPDLVCGLDLTTGRHNDSTV